MRRKTDAPAAPPCRCVNTATVAPRIGNWLNNPVSCPPSTGATSVTVAVTVPAITIRAGRSHQADASALCWPDPSACRGQHRTITHIPASATPAPATGGNAATRTPTATTA